MANTIDIEGYVPKFTDTFFFDTNVWIYLFCPIATHNQRIQRAYAGFYKRLTQTNRTIFVNSLVLSEFANAYLRIDFELWKRAEGKDRAKYKENFVGTPRFAQTTSDIKSAIGMILKSADRMTDNFNAINLTRIFAEFGNADFNDAYYLELARMNGWKIVTHDADLFRNNQQGVEIITAHSIR